MSNNRYVSNSSRGIFDDDDDVDDNEFMSRVRPSVGYRNDLLGNNFGNQELENAHRQKQQVVETTRDVEQRTLQSTERTLRLLRESENIGTATAEELVRQREQLQNTDKRLDEINSNLRVSQKHIQGIKSIFGSFKNMLSGKSNLPPRSTSTEIEPTGSPLTNEVRRSTLSETLTQANSNISSMDQHPGLRIRGLVDNESTTPTDVQSNLDNNLDQILGSVTRLKGLALGLGGEIDSQNDLVENILGKADKADINMERQNKEINRQKNITKQCDKRSTIKHKLEETGDKCQRNRKIRKRCTECYKKYSAELGSKEAVNKAKKVTTFCSICPSKPFVCLQCFQHHQQG